MSGMVADQKSALQPTCGVVHLPAVQQAVIAPRSISLSQR